jgi:hypothetical protein
MDAGDREVQWRLRNLERMTAIGIQGGKEFLPRAMILHWAREHPALDWGFDPSREIDEIDWGALDWQRIRAAVWSLCHPGPRAA